MPPPHPLNSHIQLLMSHMLGRSVEDIWIWGCVPATCKADSMRCGAHQKPTNPILLRDHIPTTSICSLSRRVLWYMVGKGCPNNTVASVSVCVTKGEESLLLMSLCKCQSSPVSLVSFEAKCWVMCGGSSISLHYKNRENKKDTSPLKSITKSTLQLLTAFYRKPSRSRHWVIPHFHYTFVYGSN